MRCGDRRTARIMRPTAKAFGAYSRTARRTACDKASATGEFGGRRFGRVGDRGRAASTPALERTAAKRQIEPLRLVDSIARFGTGPCELHRVQRFPVTVGYVTIFSAMNAIARREVTLIAPDHESFLRAVGAPAAMGTANWTEHIESAESVTGEPVDGYEIERAAH
jgi:hypothetical protein